MSDAYNERKADEALREYLETVDNHKQLLDKYFPVGQRVSGKAPIFGKPTKEGLRELEGAVNKVAEAWEKLLGFCRR